MKGEEGHKGENSIQNAAQQISQQFGSNKQIAFCLVALIVVVVVVVMFVIVVVAFLLVGDSLVIAVVVGCCCWCNCIASFEVKRR